MRGVKGYWQDNAQLSHAPLGLTQTMTRPALRPGELPLLAFISSVMTDDLQWARDEVVAALDAVPFTVPWAFEFTPASPEEVVSGYLRRVREANFFIWLVSDEITQPVLDEINEALAADVPIVALLLHASARSDRVQEVMAKVRPRARYRELAEDDPAVLRAELEHAMGDEIVRALRGLPSMSRLARVQELGRTSRARIIERLQAAGVPAAQAMTIADDPAVGPTLERGRPTADRPLVVVSSPVGAGKSLFGERMHQRYIERYLTEALAPVPVWIPARDAGNLLTTVLAAAEGLGDARQQGAAIVIDGADEAGPAAAEQLLRRARTLVRTWPHTTVLMSTRPIPLIGDDDEIERVPELSTDEAREIVSRIAGSDITIGRFGTFAQPVREAVKRPLFAVLLGSAIREGRDLPQSRAGLIAALVEQSSVRSASEAILRRLAVASLKRGGGPAPIVDVASPREVDDLLASRLVVRRGESLLFPLIIFAQWFAAGAVAEGEIALEDILQDESSIDDWLYPFAICVARYRADQVDALLSGLARRIPGFCSRVIEEATTRWDVTDVPAPPSLAAARAVRSATAAWADGIGTLGELIAPLSEDGALAPLGARANGANLILVWYWGPEQREDVFELPDDFSFFEAGYGWGPGKFARPGGKPAWPWRWSLEGLSSQLERVLKERELPVRGTPLFSPALYQLVASINNHGALTADEFDIAAVQARIEPDTDVLVGDMGEMYPVTGLHADLQALLDEGKATLQCPFPGPDRDWNNGGWIWDPYSPERLLERTTAVYTLALEAFSYYVATYFASLANRMAIATTLPAVLRGTVAPPGGRGLEGGPVIRWHLEALSEGETSRVELELDPNMSFIGEHDEEQYEHLRQMRPHAAKWLHHISYGSVLDVFNVYDAAELTYTWLWSDLAGIDWVSSRTLPGRGFGYDRLAIR